jgi:type II secretory pathway predicted ATPase ExeA
MLATRESVRNDLRIYMSRAGCGLREFSDRAGYAYQTMRQFASGSKFGTASETGQTAQKLAEFMAANPPALPEFPGSLADGRSHLYETEATRAMRGLIDDAREGVWGTCYGPAGAQKTFLFETVHAESVREPNPWFAMVPAVERMSPRMILREINRAIAAPYAWQATTLRDSILYELRRRKNPVAVVIDEAQLLYPCVETLECLRRLGDLSRGRMGIIVAGNEEVVTLFEPRRHSSMEQWRSRIEQRSIRVLGPSKEEARKMVRSEIPGLNDAQVDFVIAKAIVEDPLPPKKRYVNMRRLFNALRDFKRERARQKVQ